MFKNAIHWLHVLIYHLKKRIINFCVFISIYPDYSVAPLAGTRPYLSSSLCVQVVHVIFTNEEMPIAYYMCLKSKYTVTEEYGKR